MINLCEYSIYHLDGPDAVRHLPVIGGFSELDAIQYTVGPQMANDSQHWIGVMKQIQALGKATWMSTAPEIIELILDELDPRGLFIFTSAPTPEAADAIVKKVL